jgi:hypothetical protein
MNDYTAPGAPSLESGVNGFPDPGSLVHIIGRRATADQVFELLRENQIQWHAIVGSWMHRHDVTEPCSLQRRPGKIRAGKPHASKGSRGIEHPVQVCRHPHSRDGHPGGWLDQFHLINHRRRSRYAAESWITNNRIAAVREQSYDTIAEWVRFRRTVRLLRGLRLNLSKSGISASIGTRGAWLTVGRNGRRTTLGLPGTGISYTTTSSRHEHQVAGAQPPRASAGWLIALLVLLAIAAGIGWLIVVAMR